MAYVTPMAATAPSPGVRKRRNRCTESTETGVRIPPKSARESADFYEQVFGWRIRERGDGKLAFDDTTGEVSGTWATGRPPSGEPGVLVYVMVDDVASTIEDVLAHGGELVQAIGADAPEVTARLSRPGRQRRRPLPGADR